MKKQTIVKQNKVDRAAAGLVCMRVNLVLEDDYFVIFRIKSNLVNLLSVDLVTVASNNIHASHLRSPVEHTLFVVIESDFLFLLRSLVHSVRVQLCPKTYQFRYLFAPGFIFAHDGDFFSRQIGIPDG